MSKSPQKKTPTKHPTSNTKPPPRNQQRLQRPVTSNKNKQVQQNGAGNIDTSEDSFLFTGKSSSQKEDEWLIQITRLITRKKKVPEADKFTTTMQILYDDLLKELCTRCGESFKPMFQNDEEGQSDSGQQRAQTPRDNSSYDHDEIKELSDKLSESASKLSEMKNEKEKIEAELSETKKEAILKFDKQAKEHMEEIEMTRNENNQLKDKVSELESKLAELKSNQKQISNSVEAVDTKDIQLRLTNMEKVVREKEQTITDLQKQIQEVNKQKEDTHNRFNNAEKKAAELSKNIETTRIQFQDERDKRKAAETENSNLRTKLEHSNSDIAKLKSENAAQGKSDSTNKEQITRLTSENERLKKQEKELRSTSINKEKEIQKLHEEANVLKAEKDSLDTVVKEIKIQLEEEKAKAKKEKKFSQKPTDQKVKELQEENDKLRDRLSQIAGNKLTQGNPAITDLGDPNRPTLLGEKFSELYDNEWTDAMEELGGNDEKSSINTLKTIIEKAYEFGKTRAANFAKGLEKALLELSNSIEVTDVLSKYIKDHRKNISLHVTDGLHKSFIGSHTEYNIGGEGVKNFIKKAVGLCWLMAIQDPPVILTTKLSGKFDTDRFRHYTKSGSTVDFVVWPVVYLHEGGPIICKGVAQGK